MRYRQPSIGLCYLLNFAAQADVTMSSRSGSADEDVVQTGDAGVAANAAAETLTKAQAKKRYREEKKKREEEYNQTVKMLVLVQRMRTFDYRFHPGDAKILDFLAWIQSGSNNTDYLVERGLATTENGGPEDEFVSLVPGENGCFMTQGLFWISYQAARSVCDGGVPAVRYAYLDNFVSCFDDKSKFSADLARDFNLIVLCPAGDIRRSGDVANSKVEELHRFCAYDCVRAGILTYPPISVTTFFEHKLRRDAVFEEYMVPHVYLEVTDPVSDCVESAFQALRVKYEEHRLVSRMETTGIVGKTTNNHCGHGVYFFRRSVGGGDDWELSDGGDDDEGPAVGALLRFEPVVPELLDEETRIYCTRVRATKSTIRYKVVTCRTYSGEITQVHVAHRPDNGLVDTREKRIAKRALDLFARACPQYRDAMTFLTFRVDVVHVFDETYINEIDVVPSCSLFLDDFHGNILYVRALSDCMATYIKTYFGSWRS